MVCHHCGVKGHGFNECLKLTHVQRKEFCQDRNKARSKNSNTAPKEDTTNAAAAEVVDAVPTEDGDTRIMYETYQRIMSAMEDLDIGMIQVDHPDTVFVKYMNVGVNLLSRKLLIPVRACIVKRPQKASISGSRLTRTRSTWTVVRRITPHL